MTVIETERLTLRQLTAEDAPFIFELLNEPSWIQNIGDRHIKTLDDARAYIMNGPVASYTKNGFGLYLVVLKETNESIGMCGLIKRDGLDDVDIGYALLPRFWSKGYAIEAARAAKTYAKDVIGLNRIVAIVDPANEGSIRVLERLGMRYEKMVRLSEDDIDLKLFGLDLDTVPDVTSSINQFTYRPELIETGTVYHYIKSNIDGSYPARIYIYIKDNDHLEVLKFEEHGMDAAFVTAHMDWDTFSADQLASWVLTQDGGRRPQASLSASFEDKTFTISWREQQDVIRVGHYPIHIYNFDFISLNYILRHWSNPEGEVTVGILQPNFDPNPETMMKYEGTVVIQYLGNEERNTQPCRKYRIGGDGLRGHTGMMWINMEKGILEDIEIPIPDNPDWDNFKFNFISSEQMDSGQWAGFMDREVKSLKSK